MATSKYPPGSAKVRATGSAKDAFVEVLEKTVEHAKNLGVVRTSAGALFPGGINDIEVELTVDGVGGFKVALKGPAGGTSDKGHGTETGIVRMVQLRGGVWILRDGETDIGFMLSSKYDRNGVLKDGHRYEHWIFTGTDIYKPLSLVPHKDGLTDPDDKATMSFIEACANDPNHVYNYIQALCPKYTLLVAKPKA